MKRKREKKEIYIQYAEDVVAGKLVACNFVVLACQRFLSDLKRKDLVFRKDKVERVINFIFLLKHFKGKSSGLNFKLENWEIFILANLFGFYYKKSGKRRFRTSYLECARKQGKTALMAAISLYLLIADGEDGAEVLFAANSREQASFAFEYATQFAKQLANEKVLKNYRNYVKFFPNNSILKVLAADDSKLDGYNASAAIIDEYHAAKDSKVKDVIASSMGMRENPLLLVITTAGFDKTGPCYQLRQTSIEVLQGLKEDDTAFIVIYSLDDDDDFTDEEVWIKANPNLGVTVTKDSLKADVVKALNNPNEEGGVRTKQFNQWLETEALKWIPINKVMKAMQPLEIKDFDKLIPVYVGVDLAAVSDLTAVTVMQFKEETYFFKTFYYLPEEQLTENVNKVKYNEWFRNNYLIVNQGEVTDYYQITQMLKKLSEEYILGNISYDKWNATQFAIECTTLGLPLHEFSQSIGNFSGPTKEFERLLLSNQLIIDRNPINLFCFNNAVVKEDWNENRKIVKTNYNNKIDGVVSMIMALGGYLKTTHYSNTI